MITALRMLHQLPLWSGALPILLALTTPAHSTTTPDPIYSPIPTTACVVAAASRSPSLSGHDVLDCVGRGAQACMATPGGDTTVGMMACLRGELAYWDVRLNAAYAKRMAAAQSEDAEMASIRATTAALSLTATLEPPMIGI